MPESTCEGGATRPLSENELLPFHQQRLVAHKCSLLLLEMRREIVFLDQESELLGDLGTRLPSGPHHMKIAGASRRLVYSKKSACGGHSGSMVVTWNLVGSGQVELVLELLPPLLGRHWRLFLLENQQQRDTAPPLEPVLGCLTLPTVKKNHRDE